MNIEENEIMNPIKLAFFTAITTFIGAYAWMILLHVVVEIYESTKHLDFPKFCNYEIYKYSIHA
jgi:hypothetical protein